MSKRIALVGVGRMGANMARCLHEKGYTLTALYDAHRESALVLGQELGVPVAESLQEVTARADVIFTVVTDDRAMRGIFKNRRDHLLMGKTRGKVFINCATVSPAVHLEVEALCKACQAASVEACMASSIPQAREGKLFLMVAGEKRAFAKVESILADISLSMRYIGKTGSAAQVKALVNMVMNMNTAALAAGLALGDALGLDLTMLREVFSQTGANSRVLATDGEDMQNREHDCFFSASHAAKDSGIAASLARSLRMKLPLNEATLAQYRKMEEKGLGHLDKSGIAELTFKGRS